ncbi:hypothetical protein ATO6_11535 [Oceanicola sp. 22II-s10i]|uniref:STAS domain-containing protein n=1 Tax=Oceanicola sp. 22II-s10i TaxID=1317116 RepID=UPI000B528CF4|nr:STAS domain-containing protein [Oceanicola sp. 22II-s10i]OWU84926.1 hypothetical protein ATO6_11535 [Oceanicola sp. 22II-s10i]
MSDSYRLPARLDLPAAEPLAQALRGRLGANMTLDGSDVTHLGALCLQVLLSAARTVRHAGHDFALVNASDRLTEQLASLGFTPDRLSGGAE